MASALFATLRTDIAEIVSQLDVFDVGLQTVGTGVRGACGK